MKKILLLASGLVVLVVVTAFTGCGEASPAISEVSPAPAITGVPSEFRLNLNSQQEGIWVSGTGEVSAAPDIVTLRLGIEAQEATVAEAQSQAAEAMERVMSALTDNEVAEKDIQTQYFNIRQVTRWDNERNQEIVIGYRVTNMVATKIREMDKVGSIIDVVAAAGGDLTRIDSIDFSVDDPSVYHEEARQKAIADAEARAGQLAELTGVKLGKPFYVSESAYIPSPVYPRVSFEAAPVAAPAAVEMPISPGEMEISLTVQIAYAIQD